MRGAGTSYHVFASLPSCLLTTASKKVWPRVQEPNRSLFLPLKGEQGERILTESQVSSTCGSLQRAISVCLCSNEDMLGAHCYW